MSTSVEPSVIINNNEETLKRPCPDDNKIVDEKKQKTERIKKRNFALMMGYLGKDYYGMQRNPHVKTIEEDLIGALFKAKLIDDDAFETIQNANFQRAARTDKGVSATRQVCSVKLAEHASVDMINEHLPKEIRVFGLKRATKGFNCKSQCNARTYTYTLPTFAFAPDDPKLVSSEKWADEEIAKRTKELEIIDGKPFTEYRITPEIIDKVNEVLKVFEGTHNFHNFTARVRPFDPRAKRFIMKFHLKDIHESNGIEYATLLIKGQSFMLHQIRKMVAVAIGVVRNLITIDAMDAFFQAENKMDVPIAPSLGLVLNHVHYDNYNKRYGSDGLHEILEWSEVDDQIQKFHMEFISKHIEDTEFNDKSMLIWLGELAHHTFGPREDKENKKEDDIDNEIDNEDVDQNKNKESTLN